MNDNDFKYVIADISSTSIGSRFTYEEILMNDRIPLKFQNIVTIYILREMKVIDKDNANPEKTMIGNHIYELANDNLIYNVYKRLKLKVKFTFPNGKGGFKSKNLKIDDFKKFVEKNGSDGLFIQEVNFSNLALMSFSV